MFRCEQPQEMRKTHLAHLNIQTSEISTIASVIPAGTKRSNHTPLQPKSHQQMLEDEWIREHDKDCGWGGSHKRTRWSLQLNTPYPLKVLNC